MTIKEVNTIFKTKYPTGEIFPKGNFGDYNFRVSVMFDTNSKVYSYNVQNYVELLKKLGFNVEYQRRIDYMQSEISRLENILANGREEESDFFFDDEDGNLDDKTIEIYTNLIQQYKNALSDCIAVNG